LRHRPAGVLPLELWDVMVGNRALYQLPHADQPAAIADVVVQLREGRARRLRPDAPLARLAIDEVVLAGGRALDDTLSALHALSIVARCAPDPLWIAEPGGRALLATFSNARSGIVLDVGQTALKLIGPRGRAHLPRPLDQVPLELHARDPALQPTFRANTVAFIAAALAGQPRPDALVLALPCEVADDLTVSGCSYPWRAGDARLVHDILRCAGLLDLPCWVLNDAELAALSVGLAGCPAPALWSQTTPRALTTLVLTLGLGVGAAALPRNVR
jgi:hypothetical protein